MNTLPFFYLFLRSSNAHTPYDDIVSNYQGEVAEYLASVIFPSTCTELAPSHAYYGRRKKNNPTGFQILCFFSVFGTSWFGEFSNPRRIPHNKKYQGMTRAEKGLSWVLQKVVVLKYVKMSQCFSHSPINVGSITRFGETSGIVLLCTCINTRREC